MVKEFTLTNDVIPTNRQKKGQIPLNQSNVTTLNVMAFVMANLNTQQKESSTKLNQMTQI